MIYPDRHKFLKQLAGAGIALVTGGRIGTSIARSQVRETPAPYDLSLVKAFVVAGHSDFPKTERLLAEYPNLLNSAWDWGGGDFETAIGGAGHTGSAEIAEFLISKGARVNLFVLTMLGKSTIVKSVIEEFPELLTARGPHGFSLLHHAGKGGIRGTELAEYFQARGLTETRFPI
jgi:hypothetical protein